MQAVGGVLIGGGVVSLFGFTVMKPEARKGALNEIRFFFTVGQCLSVASIGIDCHMSLDLPAVAYKVKQVLGQ